jgi:hypothetical protein
MRIWRKNRKKKNPINKKTPGRGVRKKIITSMGVIK